MIRYEDREEGASGTGVGIIEYSSAYMNDDISGEEVVRRSLIEGTCSDPFGYLGPHATTQGAICVRTLMPEAERVELIDGKGRAIAKMRQTHAGGIFEARLASRRAYRLRIFWSGVGTEEVEDAYAFGPLLTEEQLAGIANGDGQALRGVLGAFPMAIDGIDGVRFAVWAPNAQRVSVVGDFNGWNGLRHPMRLRHRAGVWEIFLPGVVAGARYKYEILTSDGRVLPHKADPVARQCELPPATASIVPVREPFQWNDAEWLKRRAHGSLDVPLSIYEVHIGSWRRKEDGQSLNWDELAEQLIPYVRELGFTHIELLPISEYPFGGSWGYQPIGLFAPTARYGSPKAFARFVDACHQANIGVIVDWVSAHFPNDEHGLQRFDGTALYEHSDPREGFHCDWNTLIYNYGRNEVAAYLIGSALEWIERFHIDGLRVDAVASMLYRDYSRLDGEWVPNIYGGRENLEAVAFLRRLNSEIRSRCPGVMTIAEESTAWPGVTVPVEQGGLGFTHKWNMGWMHDTLSYMHRDPVHRRFHHTEMTFGLVYAFSERFVLPLSHDEVVYGKGALLSKMPGDSWQRFANLRAYYGFMWAHPGSKLLFMGGEFGQWQEWDHDSQLDWALLDVPQHQGLMRLVTDLNSRYRLRPALFRRDHLDESFEWSIGDDSENSVFAFVRYDRREGVKPILAVSNFTPVPRHGYRVGVPCAGRWSEVLNTDSSYYGGSNVGNAGAVSTEPVAMHGHQQSLALTLPPLATLWLQLEN